MNTSRLIELLNSSEMIATLGIVLTLWAIIGGPMRFMKARYKWLIFCIAASLLGASMEKLARIAGLAEYESITILVAKTMVVVSRWAAILIGAYVLFHWNAQCNDIKQALARRHPTVPR